MISKPFPWCTVVIDPLETPLGKERIALYDALTAAARKHAKTEYAEWARSLKRKLVASAFDPHDAGNAQSFLKMLGTKAK